MKNGCMYFLGKFMNDDFRSGSVKFKTGMRIRKS
jgi:hypothetical protein